MFPQVWEKYGQPYLTLGLYVDIEDEAEEVYAKEEPEVQYEGQDNRIEPQNQSPPDGIVSVEINPQEQELVHEADSVPVSTIGESTSDSSDADFAALVLVGFLKPLTHVKPDPDLSYVLPCNELHA